MLFFKWTESHKNDFQEMKNKWRDRHKNDLQEMKNKSSCDGCLQYFNHSKALILQVDASKRGLGVVLIPKDHEYCDEPVPYTLENLTLA